MYFNNHGAIRELARHIVHGIEQVPGVSSHLCTVPKVSAVCETTEDAIPKGGAPYGASHVSGSEGLTTCSEHERQWAIILGRHLAKSSRHESLA